MKTYTSFYTMQFSDVKSIEIGDYIQNSDHAHRCGFVKEIKIDAVKDGKARFYVELTVENGANYRQCYDSKGNPLN